MRCQLFILMTHSLARSTPGFRKWHGVNYGPAQQRTTLRSFHLSACHQMKTLERHVMPDFAVGEGRVHETLAAGIMGISMSDCMQYWGRSSVLSECWIPSYQLSHFLHSDPTLSIPNDVQERNTVFLTHVFKIWFITHYLDYWVTVWRFYLNFYVTGNYENSKCKEENPDLGN